MRRRRTSDHPLFTPHPSNLEHPTSNIAPKPAERRNNDCYYARMSRLYFETDAGEPCPVEFGGANDVVVHFLSLAFSTRYGSLHPLSQFALLLRGERKINMTPLTTFADRNVEVEEDAIELERVWQDAAPLAANIADVIEALESDDERIAELTADAPDLAARLRDLLRMTEWAAAHNARVRLSFDL